MAFVLSKPGDVSGWIKICDFCKGVAVEFVESAEKAEDDDTKQVHARLAKHYETLAEMVGEDLAIRVKLMDNREFKRLSVQSEEAVTADDSRIAALEANMSVCKAGLAAIAGVEPPQPEITEDLINALDSSGALELISNCIMKYHSLSTPRRAAFFS